MPTHDAAPSAIRLWKWAMWTALMLATTRGEDAVTVMGLCTREPAVRADCYPPVANFPNATEELCLAQGCCWKPLENDGIPCAFDALEAPTHAHCAKVSNASRVACRNPRFALDAVVQDDSETCEAIGCCFDEDTRDCFQPFFEGYELLTLDETARGWRGTLVLRRFKRGPFGNDVPLLTLHVIKESASRVRVRITDPSFPRYEVPLYHAEDQASNGDDDAEEDEGAKANASDYHVHFYERPFGIAVTRRKTHEVLFNSTPSIHADTSFNGLVFENQFLEISTHLESHDTAGSPLLYGLGERWGEARVRADRKGDHYPMFSRRVHEVTPHTRDGGDNLGGVHPFYLQVLRSGRSHGVFFRSSTAMEVVTQKDALTFRATGGVFDFVVFSGPSALDVTSEYTALVGRPEMPPVWALGYHLGKQGNRPLEEVMVDVAGLRAAGVPLDAYWQDAEYMHDHEAFSLDDRNFPREQLQGFVDDLHFNNQYYVMLMTPAIATAPGSPTADDVRVVECDGLCDSSGSEDEAGSTNAEGSERTQYYPLEYGKAMDVFVKGTQGEHRAEKLVGSHWSAFVDFSHPNASKYWREMLGSFHDQVVPFDGVWVDADVPSSSCDVTFAGPDHICQDYEGSSDGSSDLDTRALGRRQDRVSDGTFVRSTDVAFPFDPYRQPFAPGQSTSEQGGHGNLNAATLPMAALHHASLHYNVHSLYGHQQSKTTRQALDDVLQRRSISMSRATYSGDGQYGGQLVGGMDSTWENLRLSIASVIQMNLLGLPFSGPSVGGNGRGMTKELSIRWNQAASFFPLFRNHASKDADPQSPIDFDPETMNIARDVFLRRYRHLPYMYSLFYHAHVHGHPVIRALALEFPEDPLAHNVETQYLVGPALMVSPVVAKHSISTRVYFPNATWYDLDNGRLMMKSIEEGKEHDDRFVQVLGPLATLPVHVRGGYIVPTQQASTTTATTKRGVYRLVIALAPTSTTFSAAGDLYIDDGDSLNSVQDERYSFLTFSACLVRDNLLELTSKRQFHGYDGPEMQVDLDEIVVFGLGGGFLANSSLHFRGSSHEEGMKANYFEQAGMLVLTQIKIPIGDDFDLRVEAKSAFPESGRDEEGGDEAGIDHSHEEDDGNASQGKDEEPGKGEAEGHGGKDGGGDDEGENPPPITGEQRKKKNWSGVIVGSILGATIILAAIYLVVRRRRAGYNPIAT